MNYNAELVNYIQNVIKTTFNTYMYSMYIFHRWSNPAGVADNRIMHYAIIVKLEIHDRDEINTYSNLIGHLH
jgi:hypothetical protein